jgi:hypothetical protein
LPVSIAEKPRADTQPFDHGARYAANVQYNKTHIEAMKEWDQELPLLTRFQGEFSQRQGTQSGFGMSAALIYALVAHRLSAFYDEGHWMTQAQGATLSNEWLMRSKLGMPLVQRKRLSDLSDKVATQIRNALSREAGLHTAHELMESLDPRYVSEIGNAIMDECVRVLQEDEASSET